LAIIKQQQDERRHKSAHVLHQSREDWVELTCLIGRQTDEMWQWSIHSTMVPSVRNFIQWRFSCGRSYWRDFITKKGCEVVGCVLSRQISLWLTQKCCPVFLHIAPAYCDFIQPLPLI